MNDSQLPKILENYKNYDPPVWVRQTVLRLIDGVSANYLKGLKIISLSNTEGLNHNRKRQKTYSRKRKVAIRDCQGLYYQRWHGQPAYIELFVDKIIQDWPKILFSLNFFKDLAFSEVVYHELGHHIHKTNSPEHKEREDVAETWKNRLTHIYFRDRYFYMKILINIFRLPVVLFSNLFRLIKNRSKLEIQSKT